MKAIKYSLYIFLLLIELSLIKSQTNELESGAIYFNGTSTYLVLDSAEFSTGKFTVEFFLKIDKLPDLNHQYDIISGKDFRISLFTEQSEVYGTNNSFLKYDLFSLNDTTTQISLKRTLPNQWYQITCTFNGVKPNIYINGNTYNKYDTINLTDANIFKENSKIIVGKNFNDNVNHLSGFMDDFKIFNIALESSTIANWSFQTVSNNNYKNHPNLDEMLCVFNLKKILDMNSQEVFLNDKCSMPKYNNGCTEANGYLKAYEFKIVSDATKSYSVNSNNGVKKFTPYKGGSFYDVCGTYYNDSLHIFYWSTTGEKHGIYQVSGILNPNNTPTFSKSRRIIDDDDWFGRHPGSAIEYKNNLYLFTFGWGVSKKDIHFDYTDNIKYYIYNMLGQNLKEVTFEGKSRQKPIAVTLSDKIYLFYANENNQLLVSCSSDGSTWDHKSSPVVNELNYFDVNDPTTKFDACFGKDRAGKEVIYLSVIMSDYSINIYRFYNLDRIEYECTIDTDGIRQIAIAQGTIVSDNSGYLLQIFYSAYDSDKKSIYGTPYGLYRYEYNINGKLSDGDYYKSNKLIRPELFEYYEKSNDVVKRKMINYFHGDGELKLQVWNSDKIKYRQDLQENYLIRDFKELYGVIEGPPPFVLNGKEYSNHEHPSFIEFGKELESEYETSTSNDYSWEGRVRVLGFGGQWGGHTESKIDTVTSIAESAYMKLPPKVGEHVLGQWVVKIPYLNAYSWDVLDGNDKLINTMRIYSWASADFSYEPYFLDTSRNSPNILNIESYMNRGINFSQYNHHFKKRFTWSGVENMIVFKECSTYVSTDIYETSKGAGVTMDVGVGIQVGLGIAESVHYNAFNLDLEWNWTTETETTTSLTKADEIKLQFEFPGGTDDGDTNFVDGWVHWIEYTEGQDNWWCPPEMEKFKPWCITYEVDTVEVVRGVILNVDNNSFDGNTVNVYPNPAVDKLEIKFNAQELSKVKCYIFDLNGNMIKKIYDGELNSGGYNLSWNCCDNYGQILSNGSYICKIEINGKIKTEMFQILR